VVATGLTPTIALPNGSTVVTSKAWEVHIAEWQLTYVDSPLSTIKLLYRRNKMHTYVRALIE
jgi:hypothetical protein